MEKIGTPECQLFISAYYAQNKIDTDADDWLLEKKYKNFHGFTCRDFYHQKFNIRSVVIAETKKDRYELSVLENASYKIFLEEMAKKSLFYYVPVVTNDGLVFYFEKTMTFDATGLLDENKTKQQPYLLKKLYSLFKNEEVVVVSSGLIGFPKHDVEDVVQTLERSNMKFNSKLFDLLNPEIYFPFNIDIALAVYEFPEDNLLNAEDGIEVIFSLVSQARDLTNEEYARIKKLLKKVPLEDMPGITNIIESFRVEEDLKLKYILKSEINYKNNQLLWKKILTK